MEWLGWQPQDDAEEFRDKVNSLDHSLTEIGALTHGGDFCGIDNSDATRKFLDN